MKIPKYKAEWNGKLYNVNAIRMHSDDDATLYLSTGECLETTVPITEITELYDMNSSNNIMHKLIKAKYDQDGNIHSEFTMQKFWGQQTYAQ